MNKKNVAYINFGQTEGSRIKVDSGPSVWQGKSGVWLLCHAGLLEGLLILC
jgi:hypothetical protein